MTERASIPYAVQHLLRAVPERFPGKQRLARLVLRSFRYRSPVFVRDCFGNGLWCPSLEEPIAEALFTHGVYERETITAIVGRLKPKDIFVDVGANIGAIALPVAASCPEASIICVEADPHLAAMLRCNVAANRRSNVAVVECIAGPSANPAVRFYRAPVTKFGMGSVGLQFDESPLVLRQEALDDMLDRLGIEHISLAKLDIEGGELGALRGLERRCRGVRPPTIVFEFSDWAEGRIPGQAPGDAQALLFSFGYRLFRLSSCEMPATAIERPLTKGTAMILAVPSAPSSLEEGGEVRS